MFSFLLVLSPFSCACLHFSIILLEYSFFIFSYRFAIRNNVDVVSVTECFLDLNFVVDSSSSINFKGPTNWDTTLQFVANVTRQFTIGPENVQVAFVLFSEVATVEWGLTQYQDQTNLTNAILNVRYLAQSTNLNDALYLTRTQVFAPGRGTRPGAIKATLILTDGEDNVPEEGTAWTIENATLCKNDNIRLIAIGVSNLVDRRRLQRIVSSPSDYYAVDDFNALSSIVNKLRPHFCVVTPAPATSKAFSF